jgi:hypothetical protein
MSQKRTTASLPCGMLACTESCAEYASCNIKATASLAACGLAMSECTDACAEYASCKHKPTASAACGISLSDCTESACAEYATCQKKATAGLAACGISLSDCTDAACGKAACCQQAMAFVLSWGPTLVDELNWTVATAPCGMAMSDCTDACAEYATCKKRATGSFMTRKRLLSWGDPAQARPCTDGDDDSQYGPRGDDQKCVDDPEAGDNTVEEQGYPGQFDDGGGEEEGGGWHDPNYGGGGGKTEEEMTDEEYLQDWQEQDRQDTEDGLFDEEGNEVPEGYQEVDTGDPMDPEGGDWETMLDQEEPSDDDLKKTMKQEDKAAQQEKKFQEQESKEQSRTSIRIPRSGELSPGDYHQFWNHENPSWAIQKSVKILEDRLNNASSPEEADAVRSILMNGPKAGGTYQKTKKAAPGEPGAEDFIDKEDRSPIV